MTRRQGARSSYLHVDGTVCFPSFNTAMGLRGRIDISKFAAQFMPRATISKYAVPFFVHLFCHNIELKFILGRSTPSLGSIYNSCLQFERSVRLRWYFSSMSNASMQPAFKVPSTFDDSTANSKNSATERKLNFSQMHILLSKL